MATEFIVEPDVVYVLDKNEVHLAEFKKDDENTIINPRVVETQNAETVFTFSIALNNPKWKEIQNPENLYLVNNKMYSTNFDGCFTETISDNGEEFVSVTAYERQKLLSRKYVRTWNSTTGFEIVDTFMVVVLSKGNLPLYNNGELVTSKHAMGTSGYALDALLYGTGWTTGECDVEGIFDLETDMIDVYENILKVQEIWGGILIFDSLNKTVSHRDETKFLPYSGYEVRYEKNMQSLEQLYNNKIITKLCPLGESCLNIKAVNDGSEWITNFSYTTSVLEGIENNPDILDQDQLKKWGERKLQDLCKPRKEMTVQTVLLNRIEGFELEELALNHIVDVIDYQGKGENEQLRVVGYEYGIWDYSDAIIQLSDITLESTDIFKKTVKAGQSVADGTVSARQVVVYDRGGSSVESNLKRVDQVITDVKADLLIYEDQIKASVEQITSYVDSLNNEILEQQRQLSELTINVGNITSRVEEVMEGVESSLTEIRQTAHEITIAIRNMGGDNLVKNSAMLNGTTYWTASLAAPYVESNSPPANPQEGNYWFCTKDSGSYVRNQMYYYTGSSWEESQYSRKALETTTNLLEHTSSSENFTDGTPASTKTISGRVIKFDGGENYQVSHIFNSVDPIPLNTNEEYLTLSCYVKNSSISGAICIGIMFLEKEALTWTETVYSIYEPTIFITPDDFQDLTKVELKVKIPTKDDFIPVVVRNTPPDDINKKWLDTNIYMIKEYSAETSEWIIMNTQMSAYNEETREVWTYRSFYGFYYQTPVDFDTMEIKIFYPVFTFYPAFSVYTGTDEPAPAKGLYWNNQTTEVVRRAKYINGQFIEWEQLPISSTQLLPGAALGVPMFEWIVPIAGYYEVADIKLEYNSVGSAWNQHKNEVYTKNYKMDERGFSIESGQNIMFIDEDEINATYKALSIFKINKDLAYFKKVEVDESLKISSFIFKEQIINGIDYLLFY